MLLKGFVILTETDQMTYYNKYGCGSVCITIDNMKPQTHTNKRHKRQAKQDS